MDRGKFTQERLIEGTANTIDPLGLPRSEFFDSPLNVCDGTLHVTFLSQLLRRFWERRSEQPERLEAFRFSEQILVRSHESIFHIFFLRHLRVLDAK